MIVVDTGSTDDTVAQPRLCGPKNPHFGWIDDFAAARNCWFPQCVMDWVIWLEGDDVLSPKNHNRVLDLKANVLDDELQTIYPRYFYPPFHRWRERMARRDLFAEDKLQSKNPVHEFIDGIDVRKVKYFDGISILHNTPILSVVGLRRLGRIDYDTADSDFRKECSFASRANGALSRRHSRA